MAASTDPTAQTASSQTAQTTQHQQEGTTGPQNPPTGPQNPPVVLAASSWLEDQARAGCHGSQGSLQPLPRPGCTPGGAAPHISGLQAPKSRCSPNNQHQCPHHNCTRVPPGAGTPGKLLPPAAFPHLGAGGTAGFWDPVPQGMQQSWEDVFLRRQERRLLRHPAAPRCAPGPLAPLQGQIIFSPFCQIYGRKMGSDFFFNTRLGRKITRQRAGRTGSGLPGLPDPPGPLHHGDAEAAPGQSACPAGP